MARLFLTLTTLVGCGSQYAGFGERAYEIGTVLVRVTNTKAAGRLDEVEALIGTSEQAGKLTTREAVDLREIVATARAGQWESAQKMSREVLTHQQSE